MNADKRGPDFPSVFVCVHLGFFFFLFIVTMTPSTFAESPVTGADQTDQYVPAIKDKRVGLVGNPSSIIHGQASLDVLVSMKVNLVKCFGPEHGFRGQASNGAAVGDEVDAKTRIPLISLYGQRKGKPTDADMQGIDVMVYDIQDVGTRFYTNINILRNVMDACVAHDIPLILLDRPNPSAYLIDGPILDMKFKSGVGQFPIPIAYGMTPGEFAMMINGEGWLAEGKKCKLKVIPCVHYTHDTAYELPVHPSPNLNTQQAVMLYPSLCLFEGTIINLGRGTQMPFTVLGAPALKGKYEFSFTPVSLPGMSENPLHKDQVCYGLDLRKYDINELRERRQINLSWMIELYKAYPDKARFFDRSYSKQIANIDYLAGTSDFKKQIAEGWTEERIRATWKPGIEEFKKTRGKYLLYP
jgi:uncharacterized protein YbbC (DUF1343 family)